MQISGANQLMGIAEGQFDGHSHVFEKTLELADDRRYSPTRDAPWSEYRSLLINHKLNGAILVQPSFLGSDNSYMLSVLDQARDDTELAIRGVAVVEKETDLITLSNMRNRGVIGIRLNLISRNNHRDFDIAEWQRIFRHLNDLGMHLEVYNTSAAMADMLPALLDSVDRLVIDHFGMPNFSDPLNDPCQKAIRQAPAGRVFVKASGPYRVFNGRGSQMAATLCKPVFDALMESIGPEQIVWGSDWPFTQYETAHTFKETVQWRELWSGSNEPEAKQRLHPTARSVFTAGGFSTF